MNLKTQEFICEFYTTIIMYIVYINFRAEKENDSALLVPLPDVGKKKRSDRSMEVMLFANLESRVTYIERLKD